MKIAILLHDLRGGGAERVMLRLAGAFAARGHVVQIVLTKRQGEYLNLIPPGVGVVDLDSSSVMGAIPRIARYLTREKPDAMLSALTHVNISAVLARFLTRHRFRLVLSERNQISAKARQAKDLRSKLTYWAVQYLYPRSDLVTSVSNGVAEDLVSFAKLSPKLVEVIYNPVFSISMLEKAKEWPGHDWFSASQPPVILAVGRLTRQKGFDTLIRAFALAKKSADCRLIILGEGEDREHLESLIIELELEDEVDLCGFVSNPYAYMSHCRVFALTSRWEGLPGALIESLCCGASAVATDCPSGPSEIMTGEFAKYLVPVDDVAAIAKTLVLALGDTYPARDVIQKRFGEDVAVESYLRALE